MEQGRNPLLNFATAGLEELKNIDAFQSGASLVTACRRVLNFYKEMAEKRMEPFSNYVLAEDNFKKIKKSYEQKSQKTRADTDHYNKAIKEINKAGDAYNKANNAINRERAEMMELWNSTVKRFMDLHTPYAK